MPPTHNHYVPAYYLRGFTHPTTGRLFMYFKSEKKVLCTTVESVANQLHYWSDETERRLANEVENPANPVLEKMRTHTLIDLQDKWLLSRYIICMLKRVPDGRQRVLSYAPSLLRRNVDEIRSQLEGTRERVPSRADLIDNRLKEIDSLPADFFEKVPREVWEQVITPETTPESVRAIYQMRWTLFTSGKDRGFVTCDNPVVYTRAKGIRPPDGEFFFPISADVVLYGSWNNVWPEDYVRAERQIIDQFNYWIVTMATEYVYYSGHKNWIEALIKKVMKKASKAAGGHHDQ
jgi:hypothetical protein